MAEGSADSENQSPALSQVVSSVAEMEESVIRLTRELQAVQSRMESSVTKQSAELIVAIGEAAHHNAAHLDGHLSQQLREGFERINEVSHGYAAHLDERVSKHFQILLGTLPDLLHRQMSHLDTHLSQLLTHEVSLHLGGAGSSSLGTREQSVVQRRLLTLARCLAPVTAVDTMKCRVGHLSDGGYVMLDDFSRVGFALSLGVGSEMTWDIEMADRGMAVHQFDYTIDQPPNTHAGIHFHRSKISPVAEGNDHSLQSAQALGDNRPCIVKMDIEGDEWSVLDAANDGDFDQVVQMVCEFHEFDRVTEADWFDRAGRVLRRLEEHFSVVHVHANNYGAYSTRGNVAFPEILEVTFANRRFYTFEHSTETFPTELDAPNRADLPEIVLGGFRF